jgi:hypothetical protein
MHDPDARRKVSEALKGRIVSEETRRKISEANKGKTPWNKGIKGYHTSLKGRKMPEEFRKKVSEATKGRIPWNKGKPRTEEEKRSISEGTRKAMANLPPEKWEEIKLKISKALKGKPKPEEEQERIDFFKRCGYNCLVIWEHELDDEQFVKNKVEMWLNGGERNAS